MNDRIEDELTGKIIGAAIAVHRALGPGFVEAIYEEALAVELVCYGLEVARQVAVPITYRNDRVGEHRLDLLIENSVVVELKAVGSFDDVHFAILRSYLKATALDRGLLLNFAAPTLQVKRVGADCRISA